MEPQEKGWTDLKSFLRKPIFNLLIKCKCEKYVRFFIKSFKHKIAPKHETICN